MQVRYVTSVQEIQAVELVCTHTENHIDRPCGGVVRLDLMRPGSINKEQRCPRCNEPWWKSRPPDRSTSFEFLSCLAEHLSRATPKEPVDIQFVYNNTPTEEIERGARA